MERAFNTEIVGAAVVVESEAAKDVVIDRNMLGSDCLLAWCGTRELPGFMYERACEEEHR